MSGQLQQLQTAKPNWICCQIGAREHYAVPAYLHRRNSLAALITDAWLKPSTLVTKLQCASLRSLQERFDSRLADANVWHFTSSLIRFEMHARAQRCKNWDRIQARNTWFQDHAVGRLRNFNVLNREGRAEPPIVFAFSYAARRIFEFARRSGCRTVLGQIDPGPIEEQIVGDSPHSGTAKSLGHRHR